MTHYCVISHTHWDREWYETQEQFRLRVIDLFDNLLDLLDQQPTYVFHMDAQAIVVEDYLEIKPDNRSRVERYIRAGRLLIGPWYVQNDFFLTSGEATVRNLLLGIELSQQYGCCTRIGYAPDQFGLISQLPQILRGFGIDNCVFGRGCLRLHVLPDGSVDEPEKNPAEFIWKGPDGSDVLAVWMCYWYNNAQRFSADIDKALRLATLQKELFAGRAATPYLLLMNGVDHLEAQEDLLPILQQVQLRLPADEKIYQTTMPHYLELVRSALEQPLSVRTGEMMDGRDGNLLKDTSSSRIYLKIKNTALQNLLSNQLEPLYTLLESFGMAGIYPAAELRYLWKMLIRNHAHDSICGCSKDAVHRHMEDRFAAIGELADRLLCRGMHQLALHTCAGLPEEDYVVTIFNALERPRTEIVELDVDICAADHPAGLTITAPNAAPVPFEVLSHTQLNKFVITPVNLPGFIATDRYRIRMLAQDIPASGFSTYHVQTDTQTASAPAAQCFCEQGADGIWVLENRALRLEADTSGRISLLHKASGRRYADILELSDSADLGHSYISVPAADDQPVLFSAFIPQISAESGALQSRLFLHYDVQLPACYAFSAKRRSEAPVPFALDLMLTLGAADEYVRVRTSFTNTAKDHRLRLLVKTGLDSELSYALSPFDIVTRSKWKNDRRICDETEHNSGMAAICQGQDMLSVLNCGIYSYENLQDAQGTLAFTLVRATGRISEEGPGLPEDDAWVVPENQCLRPIVCELALLPLHAAHSGCGRTLAAEAAYRAKTFQNPLLAQSEPIERRKFMGGRTAVQDSSIAELFYRPLEYAACNLGRSAQLFSLETDNVIVTALKKAWHADGYILRMFNAAPQTQQACLRLYEFAGYDAFVTNLEETEREALPTDNALLRLDMQPAQIVTLYFSKKRPATEV